MSTESQPEQATPAPPAPRIHEAEPDSGPSGAVLYGIVIDVAAAVARRQAGLDVVVLGDDTDANRTLAYKIEDAVGRPSRPQAPEPKAGPLALPHFHQHSREPKGHLFYETEKRKARKKP